MLIWFKKEAPIRAKFKALLYAHTFFAALAVAGIICAGTASLMIGIIIGVGAVAGHVMTVLTSGKLICDPYVATVVRMEGLAAGDLVSPVEYTEHHDCVGRMTRAMEVFKANALKASSAEEAAEMVSTLGHALSSLAEGDLSLRLTKPFPQHYESLRRSFNDASGHLADTLAMVTETAHNVLSGSSEIRTATDDLSRRTEQQAASLEETSATMSQASVLVQTTALNAGQVNNSISQAYKEAHEGGAVVERAVNAMSAIEQSANEIAQIISVMDSLAFQTNLLALNAGVEAARAGDAGRGFAVVANEVRALAQRSASAAQDIKNLITNSATQVSIGVNLVGETGTMLNNIVSRVGEVNSLISGISDASAQQATSFQQINTAVSDMDRMTQQNAAMVEETAAAARSMAGEAERLSDMVSAFKIGRAA